ncbi:MAG: hypothetical protein JXA21_04285 [Anaerolineae bacterium]|nr:hypothetical protein [Anaerolineae bacterium]
MACNWIAVGVTPDRKRVLGPQRVELPHLECRIAKMLTVQDAVVLEMTGNSKFAFSVVTFPNP